MKCFVSFRHSVKSTPLVARVGCRQLDSPFLIFHVRQVPDVCSDSFAYVLLLFLILFLLSGYFSGRWVHRTDHI